MLAVAAHPNKPTRPDRQGRKTRETALDRHWRRRRAAQLSWYQSLLGLPPSAPAHEYWGQIRDPDGTVLICLHEWGAHGHPSLTSAAAATPGNGLLLFFRVDTFDACLARARGLVDRLDEEPHRNPSTDTMEFALRDPDGYYVMISALDSP